MQPPDKIRAQVAELVDALASGASGRKVVEVRVFSWAPLLTTIPTSTAEGQAFHRKVFSALALLY